MAWEELIRWLLHSSHALDLLLFLLYHIMWQFVNGLHCPVDQRLLEGFYTLQRWFEAAGIR